MPEKTLHIIRHGKSSWDFEDISDIDRPLAPRGINNACFMANKLAERKVSPDLILSSPANRAIYTALIFSRVMKLRYEIIRIEDLIYTGNPEELINLIRRQDNALNEILIFGHNPAFTSLANQLIAEFIENIPTTGIVSLTYETDTWTDTGKLTPANYLFDYPKKYKQ